MTRSTNVQRVFLLVGAALCFACSGRADRAPMQGDQAPPSVQVPLERCTNGDTRDCGVTVGSRDGVVDCVAGRQTCTDERWGVCEPNGRSFTAPASPPSVTKDGAGPGTKVIAGSSTDCDDNPCNPYCRAWDEAPPAPITSSPTTTTVSGDTVSLADSNVPPGFANKGSLHGNCTSPCTSASCMSACQFDQRCSASGCVPYGPGENDTFPGAWPCSNLPDITMPPVCTPDSGAQRNLTICNRGTAPLTQNVKCYRYPGNSPQYPQDNPGLGGLVLDTAVTPAPSTPKPISSLTPIAPGTCRTYTIASSNFGSSGTESIMCNPPQGTTTTTVVSVADTASGTGWKNPMAATDDADGNASATAAIAAAGGTLGPAFASASQLNSGFTPSTVPNAFGSGTNTWAAAPLHRTATTAPTAATTLVANGCTGWGCTSWTTSAGSIPAAVAANGGDFAYDWLPKTSTGASASATLSGLTAPKLPASAETTGLAITIGWVNSHASVSGVVRILRADGSIVATVASPTGTTFSTYGAPTTTVIPWSSLPAGFAASDLGSARVELLARRAASPSGASYEYLVVDVVTVAVQYRTTSPSATIDYGGYSAFDAIPAAATVSSIAVTVVWKPDVVNPNAALTLQPVTTTGVAVGTPFTSTVPSGYSGGNITASTTFTVSLTGADLASPGFAIRLLARRNGTTSPDPDFSLLVDTIAVSATYSNSAPPPSPLTLGTFGFVVPSGATNISLRTEAFFRVSASAGAVLGMQAFRGGVAIAPEKVSSPPPTVFTSFTDGPFTGLTPADVADGSLTINVSARAASGATPTFTAYVDWVKASLTYTAAVAGHVTECNGSNNWTVSKANPPTPCSPVTVTSYPPWTYTRTFQAACPSGQRVVWRSFGWASSTPGSTRIDFRFRSYPPTGGSCVERAADTTSTPLATARSTPVDSQNCAALTSPATSSGCPGDLEKHLGTTSAECLQMDATGTPSSSPAATPSLGAWDVRYDCRPSE